MVFDAQDANGVGLGHRNSSIGHSTAWLEPDERDGLLTRHVDAEVPPRVEYALTPLGKQFMQPVRGLVTWLQTHWPTIRAARDKFDGQSPSRKAS